MIRRIPLLLILFRLILGIIFPILSASKPPHYSLTAIILLSAGLLSDILDGIIARRLGISTQQLRRLDSTVDQIFFICVAFATYIQCPDFFHRHVWMLGLLLGAEAMCYVISFLKFKKEVATHSIGAKIWTLFLFATLVEVIFKCTSNVLFQCCFWIGILSRFEIIAILLTLKTWTNDVPSLYHALLLRKGKPIKRHTLFNG